MQRSKWFFFMVTRQEEKRDANICLRSPKPKGQQRLMRIQVLLQWGFVFIYLAFMNMNLHLDRRWLCPLRRYAIHGISPPLPPSQLLPPPPAPEMRNRLSSTRLRLSRFLESLGLWGVAPWFSEPVSAAPAAHSGDVDAGSTGLGGTPQAAASG